MKHRSETGRHDWKFIAALCGGLALLGATVMAVGTLGDIARECAAK